MVIDVTSYDHAGQPPSQASFVWNNIQPFFWLYSMKQRRKIYRQLDSSKEYNSVSKESSQNEVSEVCWAIEHYFASKEEVGYKGTRKISRMKGQQR